MGYRLVSRESRNVWDAEAVADILDCLADAHTRLSRRPGGGAAVARFAGQAAQAAGRAEDLCAEDGPGIRGGTVLRRPAWPAGRRYAEPIRQFARHLGVAFQILNDLNDWHGDAHNKLSAGADALGGRPTVLLALALEALVAAASRRNCSTWSTATRVPRPQRSNASASCTSRPASLRRPARWWTSIRNGQPRWPTASLPPNCSDCCTT